MDSRSNRSTLKMFSGALIWAGHFAVIYPFTALACARGFAALHWFGVGVVTWVIGIATVIAVVAVAMIIARSLGSMPTHPANTTRFAHWMTAAIGGLALLAIVWEALPVLVVPTCDDTPPRRNPPAHLSAYR